ncbi:MAG: DinB family protein [Ignavibacteriae bacterium]|nr:DinB family protein [Ignavibacteriota bacterium]MCB9215002.1 DinB family protein [Ignavibacteria bacterium]
MTKKSLYSPEVYQEMLGRIEQLTKERQPQWGKMSVGQMLAHCNETQEVVNGTKTLERTPFIAKLFKGMIRNAVLNDKPYKQGLQTHPQYKQTSERDFEVERGRLLESLKTFVEMDEAKAAQIVHPLFGTMTREERGWSMYKHLDHHLQQFGV